MRKNNAYSLLLALAGTGVMLLSGCKPVGPNYTAPQFYAPQFYKEGVAQPPNPQGGAWKVATPADEAHRGNWWEIYHDAQLNELEEKATANNQSLRQAAENYEAALQQTSAVRANLYPSLSLTPNPSRQHLSINKPNNTANTKHDYYDLNLSGAGSWEPDFWGKIRRNIEASGDTAQATAAVMANVRLTLQAELAADYLALRGQDLLLQILKATVADRENQLALTQTRKKGGVATEVDVAQSLAELEDVRAQFEDASVLRAQLEHAIASLTGEPASQFSLAPGPLDLDVPAIPAGVPSQLLERRPDIAAQERLTAAANARIGMAMAAYYPSLTLTGTGGFESVNGGTWISGPSAIWSLGAQAAQVLFDAGQRRALTEVARHQYEAQASSYRNTILLAFQDVEDNLAALRILSREAVVEQRAVTAAQHSLDLSNRRYKGGVATYLEVLTAETMLLNEQKTLCGLKTKQLSTSVQLIRALGGGWDASQLVH
jgi:NodT family efflux transporter outer membrane factor (OMF) lipoprotein